MTIIDPWYHPNGRVRVNSTATGHAWPYAGRIGRILLIQYSYGVDMCGSWRYLVGFDTPSGHWTHMFDEHDLKAETDVLDKPETSSG